MNDERKPLERRPDGGVTRDRGTAGRGEVDAFLQKVAAIRPSAGGGRGRLIFALDATASRQPTWDQAMQIQAEMFEQAGGLGGLDVQLVFYRGYGECKASKWQGEAAGLLRARVSEIALKESYQTGRAIREMNAQLGKPSMLWKSKICFR